MITKERLEELIKEDAVIYWIFRGDILSVDSTLINRIYGDIALEYFDATYNCNLTVNLDDLYECREDAEEYAEFGNITRTERLELPTLKQIQHNTIGWDMKFTGYNRNVYSLQVDFYNDKIIIFNETTLKAEKEYEHISQPAFLSAKRLCVKLFRGEK